MYRRAGVGRIPELYADDDTVNRSDFRRIIGRVGRSDQPVSQLMAANCQAVPADGFEMFSTGDKGHVVSGRRHAATEIAADAAAAHHRNSHGPNRP